MTKRKINLLIADDAPFIQEIIKEIILGTEINLLGEASDGLEIIHLAQQHSQVDIILMDLVLPKVNGIEATKSILKTNSSLKIIACSTISQNNMILKALEAGCCDYMTKPFNAQDFLKTIRSSAQHLKGA